MTPVEAGLANAIGQPGRPVAASRVGLALNLDEQPNNL